MRDGEDDKGHYQAEKRENNEKEAVGNATGREKRGDDEDKRVKLYLYPLQPISLQEFTDKLNMGLYIIKIQIGEEEETGIYLPHLS